MADLMSSLFPYRAETAGVTVRVSVTYLAEQSSPEAGRWFWSYHIRIENGGERTVQLMERYWKIVDGRGNVHEVRGQGVVGEMPVITPGESYDYVSGCPLDSPMGSMRGHYIFVDEDGARITAQIPEFDLLSPPEPAGRA